MPRRIVFVGFKSLLDRNSGAALELLRVLEFRAAQGDEVSVLSFNCYDTGDAYVSDEAISPLLSPAQSRGRVFDYVRNRVKHVLLVGDSKDTMKLSQANLDDFIVRFGDALARHRPDVILFFGSNQLMPVLQRGLQVGARILIYLGTAAYQPGQAPLIKMCDDVVVPSPFLARLYRDRFGVDCTVIPTSLGFTPPAIDSAARRGYQRRGFVTLINPTPDKGGHVFFAVARAMADFPLRFLAVESRGTPAFWRASGVDPSGIQNLWWAPWQSDITQVLSETSILVMPSLVEEAAGKVIAEAMAMGVPVIGYRTGGIPDQMGNAGIKLSLPQALRADPETGQYLAAVPARHVAPWVRAIRAMTREERIYLAHVRRGLAEAGRFAPDVVQAQWDRLIAGGRADRRATDQPGIGRASARTDPPAPPPLRAD